MNIIKEQYGDSISYILHINGKKVGNCKIIINNSVINDVFEKYKLVNKPELNVAYLELIYTEQGKGYGVRLLKHIFEDLKLNKIYFYAIKNHPRWDKIADKLATRKFENLVDYTGKMVEEDFYQLTKIELWKYL